MIPKKTAAPIVSPKVVKEAPTSKVSQSVSVELVTTINNNTAILTNGSEQEIRDLQVVVSYNSIIGIPISERLGQFYELGDERMIGRPTPVSLLLPNQRVRFRLLQKKNALMGVCCVQVSGKTPAGEKVSLEEKIDLIA